MGSFLGPFPLTQEDISSRVPEGTKGVYLLITEYEGDPYVRMVGRSDTNLTAALLAWVGSYSHYAFQATEDDVGAYLAECNAFHEYGGLAELANAIHPEAPFMDLFCPVCGHGEAGVRH